MTDSKLIDISCQIKHRTEKAMLVFDGAKEVWLPLSQVEDNRDGTITLPEWLAKDKGLI